MADAAEDRAALAADLRREAQDLLDGGLLEALERRLGPIRVAGSVALDLMAVPDIDLYALLDGAEATRMVPLVTEIAAQLAERGCSLAKITFSDEYVLPDPRFPTTPGLYLGTTFVSPSDRTWKIDLWGWNAADHARRQDEDRRLAESLRTVERDLVLRCKHLDGYGTDFASVDVYAFAAARRNVPEDLEGALRDFLADRRS